ncbi:uncharacterized protein LOC129618689 isoform X2 [Condylostylus longicornis]|uniref:uncharacterized protein LOC129618689 isoform X2 n=1 Tax=Condylostylus longicornis TaxID=2530218 RepID=UPI00244DBB88|nr:uncharacterized protein LOC129618689 isoform X2 [Condylostylus longicornis]XP_055389567.1 uncharacterized protein LOC129618689 isoform X2 [Condylostylus longicornis]XP_055389569.1 uncharacterized protein LOC129618689 isoform X2 [Condylostylus longicornis]XP_055389570.1 uncharacterized protein LOC129618689 isoform X2 [Condylostylus longicornis]
MDILNSEITIESSYVLVPIPIIGIIILALYLLKNRKNDTKDSQKDQISNKKLDSNSQSHTTNLHQHQHHHHQQQQNSQNSKTTKSSKTRHNKRGTTNSNTTSSNDSKASSHPWLASNLKGHTDDIHDIDFSNNGKFLASCSEATNSSSSSNGLHHHHHHQHHHRVIRSDRRKESTSTDSTGSGTEDINNSSSNEDSSVSYVTNVTKNKKSKPRCNRRHNRKNHSKHNIDIDDDNHNKNNQRNEQSENFSSSSSPNSSPTASPQQKSSLRKSVKNSTKGNGKQSNVTTNVNHQHNNHQMIQKEKNCEFNHFIKISQAVIPPLRQHMKLNLQESELVKFLRYYIVDPNLLRIYGYPVESASYEGSIEIFKCLPRPFTHFKTNGIVSNNRSTTPRSDIINKSDGLIAPPGYKKWKTNSSNDNNNDDNDDACMMQMQSSDSGNGSETSSPASVDSDDTSENGEEETTTTFYTPDGSYQIFNNYSQSLKKQCVRCKKEFLVDENGEYLTKEECFYHWGKLQQIYTSNRTFGYQYSCCNGDQYSIGCAKNRLHVWTGITVGINGPYDDFIRTSNKLSTKNLNNSYNKKNCNINDVNIKTNSVTNCVGGDDVCFGKVYALDCEMCFTGLGLEVTKITVVSSDGHLVYETFVKPKCEIVDYNTRFSGITEKDITSKNNNVKTLEQVQNDLLEFIDEDTLLIGHALDNDLRALKILHTNIIDTSITFPHVNGFPYRRSLKTLTKYYLNRDIQNGGDSGHCSFEDSRACLELMLWRVRKDFRLILEQ